MLTYETQVIVTSQKRSMNKEDERELSLAAHEAIARIIDYLEDAPEKIIITSTKVHFNG